MSALTRLLERRRPAAGAHLGATRSGTGNETRLSGDFQRLWAAYSISAVGTAVSSGALPLIAITVLHVSVWQVSALAALSGISSAAIALPFGGWIEHRHKRPVMVGADLARAVATLGIPVAAVAGFLT